jgi:preprotein translocase subunit SecG
MYTFLLFFLTLDALILTIAVLLQAGQGGGLASLGGGAGTEQFMGGRQATTLLTKITWWCAGVFLFVSLILAVLSAHSAAPRSVLETGAPAPAPVQPTPLPLPAAETPQHTPPAQPSNPSPPPHR